MDIQEFSNKIEALVSDFDSLTDAFYLSYKPDFIDLNEQALDIGEDALGDKLPEYRNPEYAALKQSLGSKSGKHWDLKLEGDFRRGLKMDDAGNIFSTDSKSSTFERLLGRDIYGAQTKLLDTFIVEQITPDFDAILRKQLGID